FILSCNIFAPTSFPTRRSSDLRFKYFDRFRRYFRTYPVARKYCYLMCLHVVSPPFFTFYAFLLIFCFGNSYGFSFKIKLNITKRSEEHTSELQSRFYLVYRLLL